MEVQFGGQQAEDFDGADEERHHDGQAGDDQVVVDLADGAREGPAVGEVHEAAVGGVEQGHPPGEQQRQRQHGVPGQALGGRCRGGRQQQDLGGGVEAEPEDQPDQEHVPGLGDRPHEPAEETPHHAPGLQLAFEFRLIEVAGPQAPEHLENPGEHDHVERRDQVQEAGRHGRAHHPADGLVTRTRVNDRPEDGLGGDAQAETHHDDDRGVAEGEVEPRAQRPFPVGHELAGRVVDRRDVIGVERMTGAQRPRGERHPQPEAQALIVEMVRLDGEGEDPPPQHVERRDHQCHRAAAPPFRRGQRAPHRAPAALRAFHRCILLTTPNNVLAAARDRQA